MAISTITAGAGQLETGGAGTTVSTDTGAIGDLVMLHVLIDGVDSTAVSLSNYVNLEDLAGTASALTWGILAGIGIEGAETAWHSIYFGRATSASAASVDVATSGDDIYYRFYRVSGVSRGNTLASVIENGAQTHLSASSLLSATIDDTGVTTNGIGRIACNFIAVTDDNALGSFTGETGGNWTLAWEYNSATGTDGAIGLQTAGMSAPGTINGGSFTMSASDPWGVIGFALIPEFERVPYVSPYPQLLAH